MAKRTLSTLLVLALLMGVALAMPVMAVETGENLVANGDFETDVNADGKADGWNAPADKYVSEGSNTYLSIPQKADYMYNRIPVEPGKTYKVSVDYKNTNAEGVWIYLYQYKEDLTAAAQNSTATAAGVFTSTNGEWASYTFFVSPPGDDVAWWAPTLRSTAVDDASLAFDNLSIVEVDAEEVEIMYSGDMENGTVTVKEGVVRPGGVAVSAATEGASATLETNLDNVRSGAASLKMTNASETDSASAVVTTSKSLFGESNGGDGTQYYIEAYFKIDEAINGAGVSCAVNGGTITAASTTFTEAKDGWQKLMTSFKTTTLIYELKVTLKLEGAGTVYWDDIAVERHTTLINGDFAGRWASRTIPSVWSDAYTGTVEKWDDVDFTEEKYMGLRYDEATNEYYFEAKGTRLNTSSAGTPLSQTLSNLTMGATYKVEFDYTDGDNDLNPVFLQCNQANNPDYITIDDSIHCNSFTDTNWHHAELYIIPSCNASGRRINYWYIRLNAYHGITKIKNITMEEVTEKSGISNSDGEMVTVLENNETVSAWYTRPEVYANYANTEDAPLTERTVITALYKKEGEKLVLTECYMDTAKAEVRENKRSGATYKNSEEPVGYLPAMASRDITIPAEGEYVVKTFAWDNTGAMTPSVKAATAVTATK